MDLLIEIAKAIWFILPAYGANAFPPLMKGKIPIDRGKKLGKNRILGDGKTVEGTLGGLIFGFFVGLVQIFVQSKINLESYGFINITIPLILTLTTGALIGDMIGSFIKRRFGIPRGRPAPLLDQLDFVFGALLLSSIFYPIELEIVLFIIVVTPPIHLISNIFAYLFKLKNHPF